MKKRILIVDDELDFLHIMKLMLDGTGKYQVWTVHSASQAHHVAREFRPDLILLDCMMPGMDGGEIAGTLQADPDLKDTPFLFLSCTVSEVEVGPSKCFSGMQTYVPKNIDFEKLVELIEGKLASHVKSVG
jgi:two-component system OmpR family response regulator